MPEAKPRKRVPTIRRSTEQIDESIQKKEAALHAKQVVGRQLVEKIAAGTDHAHYEKRQRYEKFIDKMY